VAKILAEAAAGIAILSAVAGSVKWAIAKSRQTKQKRELATAEEQYPVRLTCEERNDFHPASGYREGVFVEVFNIGDRPVTVKGFGLDLTLTGPQEWHEYIDVRSHQFPVRLDPHDGLDGYIDTEAVADQICVDGQSDYAVGWKAYVDVAGYGIKTVNIAKPS
jgi:hypothetical protein